MLKERGTAVMQSPPFYLRDINKVKKEVLCDFRATLFCKVKENKYL